MSAERALVLGGGGLAGIAWEVGLLAGLAEAGLDLAAADLVVGTSAGSVVGTLLRSGADPRALLEEALRPDAGAEPAPAFDSTALFTALTGAVAGAAGPQEARARVGAWARTASTVPEEERRAVLAARLPSTQWPPGRLVVTAVDTADGAFLALDASSGTPLLDAVAASCAVPGVWPPLTTGGRRWMDGGMRSVTNADVAAGSARVLVVAPSAGAPQNPLGPTLQEELALLRRDGRALAVVADAASAAAWGGNPLDPATQPAAARAGHRQAADVADAVRRLWEA